MNYKQIYDNIINYRLDNPLNGYTEKHHILPRSLGGSDKKTNLVNLSAREHYICHLLLTKIYPKGSQEYYKMIKAYNLMAKASSSGQLREYKINVNLYENLRVELSKSMSLMQMGEGNSQYKSFWVYNPSTLECKKYLVALLLKMVGLKVVLLIGQHIQHNYIVRFVIKKVYHLDIVFIVVMNVNKK